MHFDRLNEELISGTYGKQEEPKKKRKKTKIEISDEQKKESN